MINEFDYYFTIFQNTSKDLKPVASADKPSILVMNFANLTIDEDNGFLGIGITTSIRSVLNSTPVFKIAPFSDSCISKIINGFYNASSRSCLP